MTTTISNANKASLSASLMTDEIVNLHKSCVKAPGGEALSDSCVLCHLGEVPRKITIGYLTDKQRDEAIVSCSLLSSHIFPGWNPQECTDDKLRDLFVEKAKDLAAQADKRKKLVALAGTSKEAYQAALPVLNGGFWYANDYFTALKALKQKTRLEYFKNKNAFYHGHPPEGYIHVKDSDTALRTGVRVSGYVLKNLSAVQGLVSIRRSLCFIDCQDFLEIAFYHTLLEVLGGKCFDNHFRPNGPNALSLDPDIRLTPLALLRTTRSTEKGSFGKRPVMKGEALYFWNVPLYPAKHSEGDASGFHAVCMQTAPSQKFLAFGLSSDGVTEDAVIDAFVDAFNEKPLQAEEMYTKDLAKAISVSVDSSLLPQGMSAEDYLNKASTAKLTKIQYLNAETGYPDKVGFAKRIVVKLDSSKILGILQKRK